MSDTIHIIERAFQIARLPNCRSLTDLRSQLKSEGYTSIDQHLSGPSIRKQLNALIAETAPTGTPQES